MEVSEKLDKKINVHLCVYFGVVDMFLNIKSIIL